MGKRKGLTAKELQVKKTNLEIKIGELLTKFNKVCVANEFQLETIQLETANTDSNRIFNVDILIL